MHNENYLIIDLLAEAERALELLGYDKATKDIPETAWDSMFLRIIEPYREGIINLITDQNYQREVTANEAENALIAYKLNFIDETFYYEPVPAFLEAQRVLAACECARAFGPDSEWIMDIDSSGMLVAKRAKFEAGDKTFCFMTDDGYKLLFNQTEGIWTNGDFEFQTIFNRKNQFGWPVDGYNSPLQGLLTLA